jgi:hypothetical protein
MCSRKVWVAGFLDRKMMGGVSERAALEPELLDSISRWALQMAVCWRAFKTVHFIIFHFLIVALMQEQTRPD